MSKEIGIYLTYLKDSSIIKGKKALDFSKRAAIPLGLLGIAYGTSFGAIHLKEDKEVGDSINTHISEIYPRQISKEEYKLAQRKQSDFDKNTGSYIDPSTIPIVIPKYVPEHNQLIEEDIRFQDASQLKNQLMDEYRSKVGHHRTIIDFAILSLFSAIFLARIVNNRKGNNAKRRGGIAHFTGPPENP